MEQTDYICFGSLYQKKIIRNLFERLEKSGFEVDDSVKRGNCFRHESFRHERRYTVPGLRPCVTVVMVSGSKTVPEETRVSYMTIVGYDNDERVRAIVRDDFSKEYFSEIKLPVLPDSSFSILRGCTIRKRNGLDLTTDTHKEETSLNTPDRPVKLLIDSDQENQYSEE